MNIDAILKRHNKWLAGEDDGECANLQDANLKDVDLRNANLQDADLINANLQDADLINANLRYANLRDANLQGANLQGADLRYANLRYANLRDANLQGANLDFSCLPLWCGGLDFKIDKRLAKQLLYHVINLTQEHVYFTNEQIEFANEFHRIGEVPVLMKESE